MARPRVTLRCAIALSDNIYLKEANVVFPLDDGLVRKSANLVTEHHGQFAVEDDFASRLEDFLPGIFRTS